jgi:hypothetical protein
MAVGRFFLAFVDGGWVAPSAIAVSGFQTKNFLLFDEAVPSLQARFSVAPCCSSGPPAAT